jgi:MFS family permease
VIESNSAPAGAHKTSPYSWYVLAMLTLVYTFNFVDRQIIAIVSPAIKEDLGLSDTTLGLLKGLAFAVLYTTLGLPIAWLADRYNRVTIVSVSLAVWSAFTAMSGLATSAMQLMLARIGVGVGEAGGSPPSHAIISDYFPKEKRATALSIYALGIPFGQMFAFLAGGWVLQNFGWRNAFFLVGLPGIFLAVILKLTVREPERGAADGGKAAPVSIKEGVGALVRIPTFWGVVAGTALASFTGYGVGAWVVDFFRRAYQLSYPEITVPLAVINGVVYGLATWGGGALADRFGRRNKAAYGIVPAIGLCLTIPAGLLSVWSPTAAGAFFFSGVNVIGLGLYLGPSFSLVQTLAPVRFRAFATAFYFFIINLFALGLGPLWVGWASDQFEPAHGATDALRIALSTLALPSALAAIAYFWTARKVSADWARAAGD